MHRDISSFKDNVEEDGYHHQHPLNLSSQNADSMNNLLEESAPVFLTSTLLEDFAHTVCHQTTMILNLLYADPPADKISSWTSPVSHASVLEDSRTSEVNVESVPHTPSITDITIDVTASKATLSVQDFVSQKQPHQDLSLNFPTPQDSVLTKMLSKSMDNVFANLVII